MDWDIGLAGQPVLSEDGAKRLLYQLGMDVRPSSTHGRNDCLIDSILLALQAAGHIIGTLDMQQRDMICVHVRSQLREAGLTAALFDDYLSHEEHLERTF